jgi:hypothetical protein
MDHSKTIKKIFFLLCRTFGVIIKEKSFKKEKIKSKKLMFNIIKNIKKFLFDYHHNMVWFLHLTLH